MVPKDLKFSKEHEWLKVQGEIAILGISQYAQEELGDIVYAELPEINSRFEAESECGVLESVKTVSNLYLPLKAEIIEVNKKIIETPQLINESPYEDGWLFKIKILNPEDLDNLMNATEYEDFLAS